MPNSGADLKLYCCIDTRAVVQATSLRTVHRLATLTPVPTPQQATRVTEASRVDSVASRVVDPSRVSKDTVRDRAFRAAFLRVASCSKEDQAVTSVVPAAHRCGTVSVVVVD